MRYSVKLSNGIEIDLEYLTEGLDYDRGGFFDDVMCGIFKAATEFNKPIEYSVC